MAMLDDVRACLRVTSTMTDAEIQMWIDAAIEDMRRCGVHDSELSDEGMNPLAKSAVICFVKGQYGYDNTEAERFLESYRLMLAALLNSKTNEYLYPATDDSTAGDSTGDPAGDGEGDEP